MVGSRHRASFSMASGSWVDDASTLTKESVDRSEKEIVYNPCAYRASKT